MRSSKRFFLAMIALALATPFALMLFNRVVVSRLYELPHGIRDADRPFFAFMHLDPDFAGRSLEYNIHTGVVRHHYTTGPDGLRVPTPPAGADLVVLSGDSTLFGLGLDDEQTVPARLQALLGPGLGVSNAGVPGKALVHNLLTLQQSLDRARENGVRLRAFVNWLSPGDFTQERRSLEVLRRQDTRVGLTFKESLAARFPVLHHVYWRLRRPGNIGGPIRAAALHVVATPRRCLAEPSPLPPPGPEVRERLREMERLCAENGTVLLHVVHGRSPDDPFIPEAAGELRAAGAAHVIEVPGLYPPELVDSPQSYGHFGPVAAETLARGIGTALARLGVGG